MASTSVAMVRILAFLLACSLIAPAIAGDFNQDFDITYGDGRAKILEDGQLLTLTLDQGSGSGVQSKNKYLYGKFGMQVKVVPDNSAGTVTSFFLSSEGERSSHDEIDFEFLGNLTGEPYVVHTNLFLNGQGDREEQSYLWFDPTKDFHDYSVIWNPQHILWLVDDTPIREFRNYEAKGVPFPKYQPMKAYNCIWNGDEWATRKGRVKIDWSQAPFTASFKGFSADACVVSSGTSSCSSGSSSWWFNQEMDAAAKEKLRWVQQNYRIYNYCTDYNHYPQGMPPECSLE